MKKLTVTIAVLAMALFVALTAAPSTAGVVTVYSDDFDGPGTAYLHGTAPDIRPGNETWISSTVDPTWMADGYAAGRVPGGEGVYRNAFLPFEPASGFVYRLSCDVDPTSSPGSNVGWSAALGFGSVSRWPLPDGRNPPEAYWYSTDLNPTAWMLQKIRGDAWTAEGPYDAGYQQNGYFTKGMVNLKVRLDTRPTNWTVKWFVDDVLIRGPVEYTANPDISYVGFGQIHARATVDNFLLTSAIPEPSSFVLGILGLLGLGLYAWRKRRSR